MNIVRWQDGSVRTYHLYDTYKIYNSPVSAILGEWILKQRKDAMNRKQARIYI